MDDESVSIPDDALTITTITDYEANGGVCSKLTTC
jgi:hypothetical protein